MIYGRKLPSSSKRLTAHTSCRRGKFTDKACCKSVIACQGPGCPTGSSLLSQQLHPVSSEPRQRFPCCFQLTLSVAAVLFGLLLSCQQQLLLRLQLQLPTG